MYASYLNTTKLSDEDEHPTLKKIGGEANIKQKFFCDTLNSISDFATCSHIQFFEVQSAAVEDKYEKHSQTNSH